MSIHLIVNLAYRAGNGYINTCILFHFCEFPVTYVRIQSVVTPLGASG